VVTQDIKRGHWRNIEGEGLRDLLVEHFDTAPSEDEDGWLRIEYGALKPLAIKVLSKTEMVVETTSNPDVTPDVASDTIRRYNRFLEAATGFNSKQRSKRLQKKAKEGKL
jgi:hypothetical protein